MPGEKREPDYDQFLQCTDCFEVVAAYVVEHDATIIEMMSLQWKHLNS